MSMGLIFAAMFSCQEQDAKSKQVPADVISQLQAAGFDTSEGLSAYQDGYLVEYDIFIPKHEVSNLSKAVSYSKQAESEHYRTTYIVTGTPRTLRVYMDPGFGSYMQTSFDNALSRYNALGLVLSFQRTTSTADADIQILSFYENSSTLGYSAGFPSSSGNPASPIRLNTYLL